MKEPATKRNISKGRSGQLLATLETRFQKHGNRHQDIKWQEVRARLQARPGKLWSLLQMENTGGEPDVVGIDPDTGEYLFVDCSPETPKGRTSVCYDPDALESRKEHKPQHSAVGMAEAMGIDLLSEERYRRLQCLGEFDLKTSSWVKTPVEIRRLGGALFCDRRFGHVFVYHNGAQSYYAVRGFRGVLAV